MSRSFLFLSAFCFLALSYATGDASTEKNFSYPFSKKQEAKVDETLTEVNKKLVELRASLKDCYAKASELKEQQAEEEEYQLLLQTAKALKSSMLEIESKWRDVAVGECKKEDEEYSFWDQDETTLGQLVTEYGALDYLYIVPPEMAALKLHMHSNLPIPRESWTDVLEIILSHNGVGAKKLNTFTKQLYLLKQDPSFIQAIISKPEELLLLPNQTRLFYMFSPKPEQTKSTFQFFERFADAKQTFVHQVGTKIAIVSSKEEVEKLITLHQMMWQDTTGKTSRVVPIMKMPVKEMEKILVSFFGDAIEKNRPPFNKVEQEGLIVFPLGLGNSLVLIGQEAIVNRAEKVVKDTEDQLQNPSEMTVHVYACRHSDPNDLAKVLEKVYTAIVSSSTDVKENIDYSYTQQGMPYRTPDGYAPGAPMPVAPPPLKDGSMAQLEIEGGTDHFIPDPKTGNLLMVIRKDVLYKVKNLLRQLDVPKKMVQIEVLLFERSIHNKDSFGLNLLKLHTTHTDLNYSSLFTPIGKGVFEYLFKTSNGNTPRMDFAYNFLMTQEDIQFHAAPSVVTVNQSPATINILEEISINNGAAPIDTNQGTAFEKSYTRSQYGITIIMTPTIHSALEMEDATSQEETAAVTLQTNISFDTIKSNPNDRPTVDRRHIENEVRVADGETVIIGGLRKKIQQDNQEKIPFLGELPGVGKFFGSSELTDRNTEIFFFITPRIIPDPQGTFEKLRAEEMKKRPGDIPEFLERMVEAQNKESNKFLERSFKLFFAK
jgi:general secretion pathway protein D